MQLGRKIKRAAALALTAAVTGLFASAEYYSKRLPDFITAETVSGIKLAEFPEISASDSAGGIPFYSASKCTKQVTFSLFGAFPVKSAEVREAEAPTVIAGGQLFGIKLLMEGVMVTELGGIEDERGVIHYPAKNAGIETGDVIIRAGGEEITSNSRLQEIISKNDGAPVPMTVMRGKSRFTTTLTPVKSAETGKWRGGMWVRDSIAGIGTMTFINKETGEFAGLGHPICDSDTGELVPLQSGEAVHVDINETKRGQKGFPGELRGKFSSGAPCGTLTANNECGIFGQLTEDELRSLYCSGTEYRLGYRQEIKKGSAEILTTTSGSTPESYSIEIEKIDLTSSDTTKNMVIRITDERLLEKSGGIVQGMSGSPIIQDGKLVGAVTHVFVADPTRGYAIFAESMAEYVR